MVAPTPLAAIDQVEDTPRPNADMTLPVFFFAGRRADAARLDAGRPDAVRLDAPLRAGALRGAVGFFGVVTVRAVRPPEDLLDPPEAREVELRVLVFPAILSG